MKTFFVGLSRCGCFAKKKKKKIWGKKTASNQQIHTSLIELERVLNNDNNSFWR